MLENTGVYQHMIFVIQNKEWDEYKPVMQALLGLVQAEPASVADLARIVLEHAPEGGTYFDTALSFLPMEDWPTVVAYAMEELRRNMTNSAAQSILEYANLQCPEALHSYGEELARLESEFCKVGPYLPVFGDPPTHYPASALHFAFPVPYLAELLELRSQWPENRCHPTWIAAPEDSPTLAFGGMSEAVCCICNGHLHHIVTFDPLPDGAGVTGLSTLEISVCLICLSLGVEMLSYKHDENGCPQDISQRERWPDFVGVEGLIHFKPAWVALVELGSRWQRQNWGKSNHRENLNRVGGHPTWVQSPEYLPCPVCGEIQRFLMQLDDDLLMVDDQTGEISNWMWSGDSGMAYIFWCDACKVSSVSTQCV